MHVKLYANFIIQFLFVSLSLFAAVAFADEKDNARREALAEKVFESKVGVTLPLPGMAWQSLSDKERAEVEVKIADEDKRAEEVRIEHEFRKGILQKIDKAAAYGKPDVGRKLPSKKNYSTYIEKAVGLYKKFVQTGSTQNSVNNSDIENFRAFLSNVSEEVPSVSFDPILDEYGYAASASQGRTLLSKLAKSVAASMAEATIAKTKGDQTQADLLASESLVLLSYANLVLAKSSGSKVSKSDLAATSYLYTFGLSWLVVAGVGIMHVASLSSPAALGILWPAVFANLGLSFANVFRRDAGKGPFLGLPWSNKRAVSRDAQNEERIFWSDVASSMRSEFRDLMSPEEMLKAYSFQYNNEKLKDWVMSKIFSATDEASSAPQIALQKLGICGKLADL